MCFDSYIKEKNLPAPSNVPGLVVEQWNVRFNLTNQAGGAQLLSPHTRSSGSASRSKSTSHEKRGKYGNLGFKMLFLVMKPSGDLYVKWVRVESGGLEKSGQLRWRVNKWSRSTVSSHHVVFVLPWRKEDSAHGIQQCLKIEQILKEGCESYSWSRWHLLEAPNSRLQLNLRIFCVFDVLLSETDEQHGRFPEVSRSCSCGRQQQQPS